MLLYSNIPLTMHPVSTKFVKKFPYKHYIRPSFTVSPTQSEEFFLVQPLKKSIKVLKWFSPAGGDTMIDSFEHVD